MENGNNILTIHAEWLEKNGFKKEAKECFKQAKKYAQQTDDRQIKFSHCFFPSWSCRPLKSP